MMKRNGNTVMKVFTVLIMLAIFNSACSLGDIFARLCAVPTFVVTKTVDTNDGLCTTSDCSLREAVLWSNACPGTQTVQIPAGTYALTRTGVGEDAASTGDLDITDSVSILGEGNPVIDGNRQDRVFEVFAGTTNDMTGIIVQHGYAQSGGGIRNHGILRVHNSIVRENAADLAAVGTGFRHGGGVLASMAAGGGGFANGGGILSENDGTLTMDGSEVIGNSADQGGGIMVIANGVTFPLMELHETSVAENAARVEGGGLWLDNAVHASLDRFEIRDNSAGTSDADGIYNAATLTLTQGSITGNHGGINGGGIYNEPAGDITAREVLIENNHARLGGGIYNKGPARFYQSAIVNNLAERGQGGGVYNFDTDAALTIDNTTISGNQGPLGGGAIRNDGGSFQIVFGTLASNIPDGINGSGSGEMTLRNSILSGHSGGNCIGTLPASNGFNIDSLNTCGFMSASDLHNTDPLLMPLGMYGGTTPTHALDIGSPAIDSADPDRCAGTDQRGVARPQGARCDRGAYERDTAAGAGGPGETATPAGVTAPEPTATSTTRVPLQITFTKNANCRSGPGIAYNILTSFESGKTLDVTGRNDDSSWLVVQIQNGPLCWVGISTGEPNGPPDQAPVVPAPPLPNAPGSFKDSAKCDQKRQTLSVTLSWTLAPNAGGYHIYRNGDLVATLGGSEDTYVENLPFGRDLLYEIEAFNTYGVSERLQTTVLACK